MEFKEELTKNGPVISIEIFFHRKLPDKVQKTWNKGEKMINWFKLVTPVILLSEDKIDFCSPGKGVGR